MIEEFDKYVSNFDLNNKDIKLKYNHSFRVMKLSEKYSKLFNFNGYDIKLASLIGLLHDIGRFKQLQLYNTYKDNNKMDHAIYGSKILFEEGLITNFWDNEEDYEVIKFAIENHNKFIIEETNDERKLKFAKLIRDIDKLDIIYLYGYLDEINMRETDVEINPVIIDNIKKHKLSLKKEEKTINDSIALSFAFAFDINYDVVLDELKTNMKYFYERINTKNKFEDIFKEINKYIDERKNKNVRD